MTLKHRTTADSSPVCLFGARIDAYRDLVKSKWNSLQKGEKDACITVIRALAYLLDPDCVGYFLRLKSRDIQKLVNRSEQYKYYGITPSNNTVFECNEEGNLLSIKYD